MSSKVGKLLNAVNIYLFIYFCMCFPLVLFIHDNIQKQTANEVS